SGWSAPRCNGDIPHFVVTIGPSLVGWRVDARFYQSGSEHRERRSARRSAWRGATGPQWWFNATHAFSAPSNEALTDPGRAAERKRPPERKWGHSPIPSKWGQTSLGCERLSVSAERSDPILPAMRGIGECPQFLSEARER